MAESATEVPVPARKIPLTLAFATLTADLMSSLMADSELLEPLFVKTLVLPLNAKILALDATKLAPSAQILFVYAHLNEDGTLRDEPSTHIRRIVEVFKPAIMVLASPNSAESIQNGFKPPGPKTANLVFTIDRNGEAFARFFYSLFEMIRDGEEMLMAWVKLSPQGHDLQTHGHLPATILVAERGKLAFPKETAPAPVPTPAVNDAAPAASPQKPRKIPRKLQVRRSVPWLPVLLKAMVDTKLYVGIYVLLNVTLAAQGNYWGLLLPLLFTREIWKFVNARHVLAYMAAAPLGVPGFHDYFGNGKWVQYGLYLQLDGNIVFVTLSEGASLGELQRHALDLYRHTAELEASLARLMQINSKYRQRTINQISLGLIPNEITQAVVYWDQDERTLLKGFEFMGS